MKTLVPIFIFLLLVSKNSIAQAIVQARYSNEIKRVMEINAGEFSPRESAALIYKPTFVEASTLTAPIQTLFTYDQYARKTSEVERTVVNGVSSDRIRSYHLYTGDYLTTQIDSQLLNSVWVRTYRVDYQYNSAGLVSSLIDSNSYAINSLDVYKSEFTYDSNNRLILSTRLNLVNGSFTNFGKTEIVYNTAGFEISNTQYMWVSEAWRNQKRYLSEYNANNQRIKETIEYGNNNIWESDYYATYSYNVLGKVAEEKTYSFINNGWLPSTHGTFEYANDGITYTVVYKINLSDSTQYKEYKKEYLYFKPGKLSKESDWNKVGGEWYPNTQITYTYDGTESVTNVISRKYNTLWLPYEQYFYLHYGNNEFELLFGTDVTISYGSFTSVESSNTDLPNSPVLQQNYPNPFNPATTINFTLHKSAMATIIIYNTLGETIATPLSKELPSGNHSVSFEASNLPSGMYFYSLQTAEHTLTRKMLLVK